ncbi:MAG: helix-hairpin-helix domain-containing protein [Dehalococcoidia bacterium]|nr:helix-hairpin-helix domain-containing protein [Dehalococcoidia bacterium]
MISYITGKIRSLSREPGRAVIIAGGVGYEISLPAYVYQSLSNDGIGEDSNVELEIYYHVTDRQPKPMLVGFRHPSEKQFFEQLIQVEGIGPAKAAAALVFPVSTIASAIETEDLGSLQRLPGIGSRAAQKIVATLKGKVAATALLQDAGTSEPGQVVTASDARSEAIEALVTLGYRPTEAQDKVDDVIRRTPEVTDDLQDLMREIFKAQVATQE